MVNGVSDSLLNMLAERLRLALEQAGMSQAELARRIGVTPGAVSLWLSGETKTLKASNAVLLAKHLGVNPEWLATGRGQMREHAAEPVEAGAELVPVARVQLKLEAGITGYHVQQCDGSGQPIFFRRDFIDRKGWRPSSLIALRVDGDSMEPTLYDGDLVVINTDETHPQDGHVYAINYEGQPVIKRLRRDAGQWWLDSDNPRYKPKRCDEHAILVGRVVYKQSEHI
ncbi:MAG: helix-turn-helix transcriptional regulator [Rhodocyclaceae bacterium]|nr:helix-turn-helix transcriptional regulator [Rhodocyclaceae bacterium]